jgi:NAD(P)-dependent dehydrogenase (short-subunit alcohol dehydrogenase family)
MIKLSHITTMSAPLSMVLSPTLRANSVIAITRDGFGLADVLAQKLNALGHMAAVVDMLPPQCDVAILLDAFQPLASQAQAIAINFALFMQFKQIAPYFAETGGRLIAVQDTGGRFALTDTPEHAVWAAGISGLLKTAAQEWPKAHCKMVDLQRADQTVDRLADRLLEEVLQDDTALEVSLLADGRRMVLGVAENSTQRLLPTLSLLSLHDGDVMLVTGGARGVTATCLIALAQQVKLRFVLFGRTALPEETDQFEMAQTEAELQAALLLHYKEQNLKATPKDISSHVARILTHRDIRHTLAALQQAGSMVDYLPVDVLDEAALQKAVNGVRERWGPIAGVVHGAGVLADKLIVQKTPEQFQMVFDTKVIGLRNILSVTAKDSLKALVLFSSVAGRFGNPGQCDYAMANEVLNKVAQNYQRQHPSCLVKSINWGPWESGMVNAQLKKLFASRGVALIPMAVGAQIFVDALRVNDRQVELVVGGTLTPEASPLSPPPTTYTFSIDQTSHPFLIDHVVKDIPVLPACMVLEWFVCAAKQYRPELTFNACQNFHVLRGVQLTQFGKGSQVFTVTCTPDPDNAQLLKLALIDPNSPAPHYTAIILMGDTSPALSIRAVNEPTAPWPYTVEDIYDDGEHKRVLFHGKAFQSLISLDSTSDQSASATIVGTRAMTWPGQWATDALAIDTVFQLGAIYAMFRLGKRSLPAAFGEFRMNPNIEVSGKLRCILFNCQVKGQRIVFDALLQMPDGQIYAEFKEVQEVCYDV